MGYDATPGSPLLGILNRPARFCIDSTNGLDMPDIRPFRGVRYDMTRVGDLSDVVAPPYDVIDPPLQDRLYDASPYNIVRLELNREEANDAPGSDRYARAARFLKEWTRDLILRPDPLPAYYLVHQTFEVDGQAHTRKGFLARVRLEPFGEGKIYPHEQTLAGPKADRLALFNATQYNLSPIFGLYPDADGEVLRRAEAGLRDRTPQVATDHLGVTNRLWEVHDAATQTAIQGMMAGRPVFIADGHHRYETGLNFRDELAARGELAEDDPANFCLMMLVGMSDPGLIIQPTHRLVRGLPGLTIDSLADRLRDDFEVTLLGSGPAAAREAWELIQLADEQATLAFGTVADGRWCTARLRDARRMDALAVDHGDDWRALGVSILHVLVLDHLLAGVGSPACTYVHTLAEVDASIAGGDCDLACLVPAAGMEYVESIASNLEKMPPKSTYFYPKLLSGLVLNPLR